MCYHGRVIIEGCRTKCVIDKYTNIYSEAALIYLCDDICMTKYCIKITKIILKNDDYRKKIESHLLLLKFLIIVRLQ